MSTIRGFFRRLRMISKAFRLSGNPDVALYQIVRTEPLVRATSGLAVVTIVKDEEAYLTEWIEFHRLVGFDHFIIYDNGSTDGTRRVLAPYEDTGIATVFPWCNFSNVLNHQKAANAHAVANFGNQFRRMAFFDVDEFLFSPTHDTLIEPLEKRRDQPCVCVPWFNFGPNGHETRPQGLVIENYVERAVFPPLDEQRALLLYKTILDPTRVQTAGTHAFHFDESGPLLINENGVRIPQHLFKDRRYAASRDFQLNHYFTRSLEELEEKRRKGRADKKGKVVPDFVDNRLRQYALATCEDRAIMKHLAGLKQRISAQGL